MELLSIQTPVAASHGGLFVCPGEGRHQDRVIEEYELIFVRSGTLRLYEADLQLEAGPGQTILLLPGARHGGLGEYPPGLTFYWVHFYAAANGGETLVLPRIGRPARGERLTHYLRHFLDDQESHQGTPASQSLLVNLILHEATQATTSHGRAPGVAALVGRAKQLVDECFHEPVSVSDIARRMDYHADYLSAAFRAVEGMPLSSYLQQRRLREARALLRDSSTTVKRIARLCGFASESYFCRVFRDSEGLTPRGYRRLFQRITINVR